MIATTTFECVDIEPDDRLTKGPEGDLVIFRQRDGVDYEIHLRWKSLRNYAEWIMRHIGKDEMSDALRRELAILLCGD